VSGAAGAVTLGRLMITPITLTAPTAMTTATIVRIRGLEW
jgi:hypothetical protein